MNKERIEGFKRMMCTVVFYDFLLRFTQTKYSVQFSSSRTKHKCGSRWMMVYVCESGHVRDSRELVTYLPSRPKLVSFLISFRQEQL